jgi:hypothetical protein
MFGKLFGKKETPKEEFVPIVVKKEEVPASKPKKAEKPRKLRYICNSCGYRFTRASHIDFNNICPYCGKKGAELDESADAQKLIDTTEDTEERFTNYR